MGKQGKDAKFAAKMLAQRERSSSVASDDSDASMPSVAELLQRAKSTNPPASSSTSTNITKPLSPSSRTNATTHAQSKRPAATKSQASTSKSKAPAAPSNTSQPRASSSKVTAPRASSSKVTAPLTHASKAAGATTSQVKSRSWNYGLDDDPDYDSDQDCGSSEDIVDDDYDDDDFVAASSSSKRVPKAQKTKRNTKKTKKSGGFIAKDHDDEDDDGFVAASSSSKRAPKAQKSKRKSKKTTKSGGFVSEDDDDDDFVAASPSSKPAPKAQKPKRKSSKSKTVKGQSANDEAAAASATPFDDEEPDIDASRLSDEKRSTILWEALSTERGAYYDDVPLLEKSGGMPAPSVMRQVFRQQLSVVEARQIGARPTEWFQGVEWTLHHAGSGGWFKMAPDGRRRYMVKEKPESAARSPGLSWIDATISMAKDFATGAVTIEPLSVPKNQQGAAGKARVAKWAGRDGVSFFPVLQDLERDLETDAVKPVQYWDLREHHSIESMLRRARSPEEKKAVMESLRDIVYIRVGFENGWWVKVYDGQSGDGGYRTLQHLSWQLLSEVGGLEAALFHYQGMGQCEKVYTFPAVKINRAGLTDEEVQERLNWWEQVICWGLAAFQLNEHLLKVRAKYGAPRLAFLLGLNGTACLASTGDAGKVKYGIANETSKVLQLRFRQAELKMLRANFALLSLEAHEPGRAQAQAALVTAQAAFEAAKLEMWQHNTDLIASRSMLCLFNFNSESWSLCMIQFGRDVRAKLRSKYPESAEEGLFRVHGFVKKEPSPKTDIALACAEKDHARYRGATLQITHPDSDDDPAYVQTPTLPTRYQYRRMIDRILSKEVDKHEQHNTLTEAIEDDIEARKKDVADFDALMDNTKKLCLGTMPVAGFRTLQLEPAGPYKRGEYSSKGTQLMLYEEKESKAASEHLGFQGVTVGRQHPTVQARLVKKKGGRVLDYDHSEAKRLRLVCAPEEDDVELQLRSFGGQWVSLLCHRRSWSLALSPKML